RPSRTRLTHPRPGWGQRRLQYSRRLKHLLLRFYITVGTGRDRIRRRRVGDGRRLALRANGDLAGCEPLAELEQPRFREEVAWCRLAQKIDVEVDGHSQRDRADRGKHRHVHRKVRKRHHGRPRNRTAWPQRALAESLSHAAAALPHGFDRKATLGMENLRKLGEKKTLELRDRHHHWHAPPSEAATDLDDYGQMKKIATRSAHIPARSATRISHA